MKNMFAVILAGGTGAKLWPISREMYPKQLFKVDDEYSLFQKTFLAMASIVDDKNIITTTNIKYTSQIKEQLKTLQEKLGRTTQYKVLSEPISKNTAPSILSAINYINSLNKYFTKDAIIITIPADQIISDRENFINEISKGIKLAENGYIVSFSMLENKINENYGYMVGKKNAKINEIDNLALKISNFIEKPTIEQQKKLKGNLYRNLGIYMFKAETLISEFKKHSPKLYDLLENETPKTSSPSIELEKYSKIENISIDYALIEKTKKLVTIPINTDILDIGSWNAIYNVLPKDKNGNCIKGNVIDINSENTLIYSPSKLTATIGLKDKSVIVSEDAILVTDLNTNNSAEKIYKKLNGKNKKAKEIHQTVYRPWGCYTVLESGDGFLTKCIVVNPDAKLSVQLHHHRSEHWIVLEGEATVLKNNEMYKLSSGESIDIDVEEVHSLQNYTKEQVKILEIQQGDILDENDIVRLEDIYGRV